MQLQVLQLDLTNVVVQHSQDLGKAVNADLLAAARVKLIEDHLHLSNFVLLEHRDLLIMNFSCARVLLGRRVLYILLARLLGNVDLRGVHIYLNYK